MGVQQEGNCEKLEKKENDKDSPPKCVPTKENYLRGKDLPAPLPFAERWLYISVWTGAVIYCIYAVCKASNDFKYNLSRYDFKKGWSWTGRKKDVSDFEWELWPWFFFHRFLHWILGRIVMGQVIQRTGYKHTKYVMLAYDSVAIFAVLGPKLAGLLLLSATIIHISTFSGSVILVWITSLLILGTLNFRQTLDMWVKVAEPDPKRRNFNVMVCTLSWMTMRSVSFCVDAINASRSTANISSPVKSKESGDQVQMPSSQGHYTYLDHLGYLFYLPLVFTGPVMTYDTFQKEYNAEHPPLTFAQLKDILIYFLRIVFWYFIVELSVHYLYMSSLRSDYYIMQQLPLWALAGVGLFSGQFFQVKYVVMYGLPRNIAMFDRLDVPKPPKCISRIYLYSDMWKYFDRGLYIFMKRYIYIPMGGSRKGMFRQLVASFTCFSYVYFWHGVEKYMLLWTSLNFIGISMEAVSGKICATKMVQNFEHNVTGLAMGRRIRAFLAVPQTVMSVIAIFYFFSGYDVGYIFFDRLVWNISLQTFLTVYVFLYCFVQSCMEVTRWEAKKEIKTE